jgi:hypothetical protein
MHLYSQIEKKISLLDRKYDLAMYFIHHDEESKLSQP